MLPFCIREFFCFGMKKKLIVLTISLLTLVSVICLGCVSRHDLKDGTKEPLSVPTPAETSEEEQTADPGNIAGTSDDGGEPSTVNTEPDDGTSDVNTDSVSGPFTLDFVDVFGEHYETLIDPELPMHAYDKGSFVTKDGTVTYEDESFFSVPGVDVSRYQGDVDFVKLKENGFEFVFIRLGYRGYGKAGSIRLDSRFDENMKKAIDAGLDVGVYFFSQAVNEDEAREEADFVFANLKRIREEFSDEYYPSLGIVFDPESILDDVARTDDVTAEQFTLNTITFLDAVRAEGYEPILYCNMLWEAFNLEMKKIYENGYQVWYADYEPFPQTPYDFTFWQYTNEGRIDGIDGSADIDIRFIPK